MSSSIDTPGSGPIVAPAHPSATILVVDDEPANLEVLRHMLGRAGYLSVEVLQDAELVLARVERDPPDLLLLDLHMPKIDGFEVLRSLPDILPADDIVPVLVLTADVTDATRERALTLGAHDFLTKPFQYNELVLRVRNLLAVRAVHRRVQTQTADMSRLLERHVKAETDEASRIAEVRDRIDTILRGTGLEMVYQPVVDLVEGRIVGAEALARFSLEPRQGPDVWFREADEVDSGTTLELHAAVLATARISELPADTFMSVNASPEAVVSGGVEELLVHIPGWRLVVELTEHKPVTDYDELARAVARLRDQGVRLAVDDTGSGYANLRHILRLEPDIIKLDRGLVAGIDTDPVRRSLVTALLHFAAETATTVIGEGIETEAELRVLRSLGLPLGQGYLLARPGQLPLALDDVPALRLPVVTRPTVSFSAVGDSSLADAIHDGPVQDISAAHVRLQLLQLGDLDEHTRSEIALTLDPLRRATTQLSEIVSKLGDR